MENSLYNEELRKGCYYPRIVFCYFREWDGFYMPAHQHNQVEIMYALSGTCSLEVAGRSISMKNGDFVLLDANVAHGLVVETGKPCRMLNIEFIFDTPATVFPPLREILSESDLLRRFLELGKPYILLKDSDEVYNSLKYLINEIGEGREGSSLIIGSLLLQLLLQIARLALQAETRQPGAGDIYVRKAIQFMQHNYDCDIQTADIAADINIHPVYLHRIFKENTGTTIIEYLTQLRLEKAKMLLSNSDIPIIEISNYVGMNSRQYFTYLFRKHTGVTPAGYRKSVEKYLNMKEKT